jgi:hypothetical protein
MRYDRGKLYLNMLHAGSRVAGVVDVSIPSSPVVEDPHELIDWVVGLETADGRIYQLEDGVIRLATVW